MKKKIISFLMAFAMVLVFIPVSVFHISAADVATVGTTIPDTAFTSLGASASSEDDEGPDNLFDKSHNATKWCINSNNGWVVFKLDKPYYITSMTAYHAGQSSNQWDSTSAGNTKAYALQIYKGTGEPASADYSDDAKWKTVGEETNNTESTKTTVVTMFDVCQYFRLQVKDSGDPNSGKAIRFYGLVLEGTTKIPNPTIIHFLPNGASNTMEDDKISKGATSYQLPQSDFTYEGKIFTGWKIQGGDDTLHTPGSIISIAGDTTLVAQWRDALEFDVTINPGTHGMGDTTTQKVKELDKFILPKAPTSDDPENWAFKGWKVGKDSSLKQPGKEIVVVASITVEAQWASHYNISFAPGEKGEGTQEGLVILHGTSYQLPQPLFTCKDPALSFGGWLYNDQLFMPGTEVTATEARTYTARWIGGIAINEANFPDANFRAYVKTLVGAEDGVFTVEELAAIKEIDCSSKKISDLTGIEHFTAIEKLNCSYNNLTTIDISKNVGLGMNVDIHNLVANKNPLVSVKFPSIIHYVSLEETNITSLDLENVKIRELNLSKSPVTSIKFGYPANLKFLTLADTDITSLDLTGAEESLIRLNVDDTKLQSLNLEGFSRLNNLSISRTQISSINLKGCTNLEYFYCVDVRLTSLDVSDTKINDSPRKDCLPINAKEGDSLNDPLFDISKVSNLTGGTLVNGIVHYTDANTTMSYDYDIGKKFNSDTENFKIHVTILDGIPINKVNFPDDLFRDAIIRADRLNADTNGNGYLSSSEIAAIKEINMYDYYHGGTGARPGNIKGIEYFTSLTKLTLSNLKLENTEVDLSSLTELVTLYAYSTNITKLNVSGLTKLEKMVCYSSNITELNITNTPSLNYVDLRSNDMKSLDFSGNPLISYLDIGYIGELETLIFSKNSELTELDCCGTINLKNLDLSNCAKLVTLKMSDCGDITPDLSHNTALKNFTMQTGFNDVVELPTFTPEEILKMEKITGGWLDDQGTFHFNKGSDTISFHVKTGNSNIDAGDGANRSVSFGREMPAWELVGHQGKLDSTISLYYSLYVKNDQGFDTVRDFVRFTINNKVVAQAKFEGDTWISADYGRIYTFRCPVVAKEMGDEITAEIVINGNVIATFTYSFKEYIDSLISGDYDVTTKNLAKAILNYGAAAQVALDHNKNALVNSELSLEDQKIKSTASAFDGYKFSGSTGIENYPIHAKFIALNLVDRIGLKVYFTYNNEPWKEGQMNNYFFNFNGRNRVPFEERGYWCVDMAGISIKDLDKYFDLNMTYGNPTYVSGSVHISPYTYCYQVMHNSSVSQETKNVVLAIADYHDAAVAYANAHK